MFFRIQLYMLAICLIGGKGAVAQNHRVQLSSPNRAIVFSFYNNDSPSYSISFRNKPVITKSAISLDFLETGEFKRNVKAGKPIFRNGQESYELIAGKSRSVNQVYRNVIIPLEEINAPFRKINLEVRAFDDGIAFRYEFPLQKNWMQFSLTDEHTNFCLTGDPNVLALLLPNYTTSHEGEYTYSALSKLAPDTLMDMPALFELPGPIYVAITEAALLDYAGMYLAKEKNILTSKLSPLPGQAVIKVKATLLHYSPWRVLLISDRLGALIESNILTSLNEPCKIDDLSWLKPGKTTFPWWNGNVVPDTLNAPGNNFVTNQYYIDFCARNRLEYHSVVEYGLHQWYMDDGVNFQPGPHADVTTPVPGLDMKEICDYAKQHGVGIRVWVHWAALYPKLDTAFTLFEKWGIKGMMVDFMDRDDQQMVNIQTEIVQKAAQHHLHIQFHGAYKPTGLSRTWPNEFTREGTLNYEVNKWDKRITPDHDLNIVFTRMLAGPTDYHLGGFRAVPDSLFKIQYTRPLMLGTRCHMLAMYVVLQNPLGMVCDYPAAYEGQPGFEFIKEVPTTWDETKVIDARLREYIIIARKKGNDWFAGAITNHSGRVIDIPLNFLDMGQYSAEIYSDAADVNQEPNHLQKQIKMVSNKDHLAVQLAAGGGMVIHFTKSK
ncbi:MAG TPA: glycoside hydrolase family 97 protein [Chitinophagaceae bacterium]|nr:glycoside hydrolase family 97 protein [Chitinophagaceae bacterium]